MSAWRIVASCTNTCSHQESHSRDTRGQTRELEPRPGEPGSDPGRGCDGLRQLFADALDLGAVQLQLARVGAAALAELAHEDEALQMEHEVVEHVETALLLHQAASSSTSTSASTGSACAGRFERTRVRTISAPASSSAVSTYRPVWKPWSSAAPVEARCASASLRVEGAAIALTAAI